MTIHQLKIWPEFFLPVVQGQKKFEVRDVSNRDIQMGDLLLLREWLPAPSLGEYTGNEVLVKVIYMMDALEAMTFIGSGKFVFMSIEVLSTTIRTASEGRWHNGLPILGV